MVSVSNEREPQPEADAEELFRALFEHKPDITALSRMVYDDAGRPVGGVFVAVNGAFVAETGRAREELIGRRWREALPEADWSWLEAERLPRAAGAGPRRFEHFSGVPQRMVEITAYVPVDDYLVLTFRDLAARKEEAAEREAELARRQAESALKASEHQYRTLFETMDQGVVYFDEKGAFITMNPAAHRILGVSIEEMQPLTAEKVRKYARTASGEAMTSADNPLAQVLQSGEPVYDKLVGVHNSRDGGWCWVKASFIPQYWPGEVAPYQVYAIFSDVTEALAQERRLRLQAELLDSVQDSVVATDLEGKVVYWGKGAVEAFGREVALGKQISELLTLDEERMDGIQQAVAEEGIWRGEYAWEDGTGGRRWVALTISPVLDEQGVPYGFIGVGRDVTKGRQREERLAILLQVAEALRGARRAADLYAAAVEQLRGLFQAGGVAIALAEGGIIRFESTSDAWRHAEGLIQPAGAGISGQVLVTARPFYSDNLDTEALTARTMEIPPGLAGACLPLLVGETPVGVLWVVRDVPFSETEKRLLAGVTGMLAGTLQRVTLFEQVEAQALQMQRLMETVADGLLLLDERREIALANSAADYYLRLLGTEADAQGRWQRLGGTLLSSLLAAPPSRKSAHELVVEQGAAAGRIFELVAHAVAEAEGSSQGWVVVLREVTAERRSQDQVQQQERLAAVGQLAAGIAHDFNNIMSAIVLYAQMLQNSAHLPERDRQRMGLIYQQAQQAIALVHQILDFGRRSVFTWEQLRLCPLLKEVSLLLQRTLPEPIEVIWRCPGGEFVVEGDAQRLKQVILNLGVNARDAMPAGGTFEIELGRLTLDTEAEAPLPEMEPGEWARIWARDEGEGIAAGDLPHIFEPFFTTKAPGEGSGLGLAQVYGIVRQHGGQIGVESVSGRGTTFTIYLPLVAEAAEPALPPPAASPPAPGPATILVVEDEVAVRMALVATLEVLGYRVLAADDGETALALFAERGEEIDLVVSDLVMNRMGGEELHQRLQEVRPGLKMMVITGYPLADRGKALLQKGIVDWIQKPVSVDMLEARVAAALAADSG